MALSPSICLFKVTIRPRLSGQSRFLLMCPRKRNSFPGIPICTIFDLVFQICPDLPISAAMCLRIGGQKLAQILSVYTKDHWMPGLHPGPHWGSSQCSPRHPSQTPMARTCVSFTLRFAHSALVPDYGAQIMITLICLANNVTQ